MVEIEKEILWNFVLTHFQYPIFVKYFADWGFMSETSHNKEDGDEKKRHRRSRKDGHERTHVCSQCQKSYLSNAALYTHTKTKHSNIQNPGEKGPQKDDPEHQGRGVENSHTSQQNPATPSENRQGNGTETNSTALEELRNFMKKYFPERNKASSVRLVTEGLPQNIHDYIQPLLKEWEDKIDKPVQKNKMSIDNVFAFFLTLMNLRVSSACMNFLIRVFFYIREGLKIQHRRNLYCDYQGPSLLPNDFNNLILNRRVPPDSVDEDELMNNPTIICRILEHFGHWLYDERFTDYKIMPKYQLN